MGGYRIGMCVRLPIVYGKSAAEQAHLDLDPKRHWLLWSQWNWPSRLMICLNIASLIQTDGVKLLSLPVALEEPVYRIDPNQLGQRDMTSLIQLSMSRKGGDGSRIRADTSVQFDPAHNLYAGLIF